MAGTAVYSSDEIAPRSVPTRSCLHTLHSLLATGPTDELRRLCGSRRVRRDGIDDFRISPLPTSETPADG